MKKRPCRKRVKYDQGLFETQLTFLLRGLDEHGNELPKYDTQVYDTIITYKNNVVWMQCTGEAKYAQDITIAERVRALVELSQDAHLDLIVKDVKTMEKMTFGVYNWIHAYKMNMTTLVSIIHM